jgi:3-hydroxyisobutyrate dehydrogenase
VLAGTAASRGYTGGFASDLMLKDLGLAADAAAAGQVAAPLGLLAREIYRVHKERGRGQLDFSSVFEDVLDPAELLARVLRAAR